MISLIKTSKANGTDEVTVCALVSFYYTTDKMTIERGV